MGGGQEQLGVEQRQGDRPPSGTPGSGVPVALAPRRPAGSGRVRARGPVICERDTDLTDAVFEAVDLLARREGVVYLKLQPPVDRFDLEDLLLRRGFVKSGVEAGPTATVRLDLGNDPDELLQGMRASARRNVRMAARGGVEVRDGGTDDLATFGRLVEATRHGSASTPIPSATTRRSGGASRAMRAFS